MNFQVINSHKTVVRYVWGKVIITCILSKCLCFWWVLYCTVLYRIHYSIYQTPIYLKASIKSVVMLYSCISCCWGSFSSTIHHFPPPSPSQELLLVHYLPAPVCPLLYSIKVLYCKIKNASLFFVCSFFMYYLYEKYYKPITVKYYLANCASWVPRLTLLSLWINWLMNTPSELNSFVCRGLNIVWNLESRDSFLFAIQYIWDSLLCCKVLASNLGYFRRRRGR